MYSSNPLRDIRDIRLGRIAGPAAIVIFGITGDLARKKLIPAIYDLANRGLLSPNFSLVGFGRRSWDDSSFAVEVERSVKKYARTAFREDVWGRLVAGIRFVSGELDSSAAYVKLSETLKELDENRETGGNHAFYLSVPPKYFPEVCKQISGAGLSQYSDSSWKRVIVEKPFGHDLSSAQDLNKVIENFFIPDSIFRIDHYLGKETVQNILALRFGNQIFEPLWSNKYIDHVQITMAEDIGIEGRAGYYDGIGTARDVIQNHLLQLLALTAMEEPGSFSAQDLCAEKEKVLSAVRLPEDLRKYTSRGQYLGGLQGAVPVKGYLEEEGISPSSRTETYAAMRLDIDNKRWRNVPFYLRAGKRLSRRVTEIAIVLKRNSNSLFSSMFSSGLTQNSIVFRVQPEEGVTICFASKIPGSHMEVRDVTMDFLYGDSFVDPSPEAYERLILDVLLGEPPLFPRHREVELSWEILDPIENFWMIQGDSPDTYLPGTWGPDSADSILAVDGRAWRRA